MKFLLDNAKIEFLILISNKKGLFFIDFANITNKIIPL